MVATLGIYRFGIRSAGSVQSAEIVMALTLLLDVNQWR